jgi:hypothetical protein
MWTSWSAPWRGRRAPEITGPEHAATQAPGLVRSGAPAPFTRDGWSPPSGRSVQPDMTADFEGTAMIRLLVSAVIYLVANAIGLLVANALLDDMSVAQRLSSRS